MTGRPSADDRPRKSLIVCTTPRSGSGLLCDYLTQSEVAGRPRPYFAAASTSALHAAYEAADARELVAAITAAGTGDNGIFGLRIGIGGGVLGRMLAAVEAATGEPGLDGLWAAFGPPTFVWATRRDKVRQAISWWRATQTGRWRSPDPADPGGPRPEAVATEAVAPEVVATEVVAPEADEPEAVDHDAVAQRLRALVHREAAWDRVFDELGVVPITVVYEDWIRRREDTLRDLCRALGERPASLPVDSALRRQADAHTERWRAEVIGRAEARGPDPTTDP